MKKPKHRQPRDAHPDTVWFGGPMPWFAIHLAITADDLKPDEISAALGVMPSEQWERGEPILRPDGSLLRIPKFGHWSLDLSPQDTDQWDLCPAIWAMARRVTAGPEVWRAIGATAQLRLSLALWLETANQGFALDADLLAWLAERGIGVSFDIYAGDEGEGERPDRGHKGAAVN